MLQTQHDHWTRPNHRSSPTWHDSDSNDLSFFLVLMPWRENDGGIYMGPRELWHVDAALISYQVGSS